MRLAALRTTLLGSAAIATVMTTNVAFAQNINASNFTLLERLVIGAGAEKVAINTPQAVTVVSQDDIDKAQAGTTGDIFDSVPGVTIVGSERALGEAFNIRGIGTTENSSDGSRIIVNVDGMPKFYEQYRMGSFFSDPELYKQVEVLRGPASSTLYGAGAIGGVINFTTKDPSDFIAADKTGAVKLKESFDSNGLGTLTSGVIAHRVNETFEVLAAGNWRRNENITHANGTIFDGSAINSLSGLIKGVARFGDNDEQTIKASYQHFSAGADQMAYAQTGVVPGTQFGYTDRHVTDKTAIIEWSNPASDNSWLDYTMSLSYSDTLNAQRNHRAAINGPLTNAAAPHTFADSDFEYKTLQFKGENTVEWLADDFENFFTFGLQASSQDRSVFFPAAPATNVSTHPNGNEKKLGLFSQDEFIWNDRLTLIGGMRVDGHWVTPTTAGVASINGYALSPKLSALFEVNEHINIFGSVAHTERLPTIDELYSSSAPSAPSGRNPLGSAGKTTSLNLVKEKANSVEGGFSLSGFDLLASGDNAAVKVTGFYNHITDMIASNPNQPFGAAQPTYYGNINQAELYGVEVEAAYNSDYVFANLAYTFTIGNNLATNTPLTTVPQNKIVATIGGRHPEWNLEGGARITLADDGRYETTGSFVDGTADPWARVDLFASWTPDYGPMEGTEMRFGIDNLLNADYRENLSTNRSTGRTFKLTLAKQFDY